jgi:hypothetical protein
MADIGGNIRDVGNIRLVTGRVIIKVTGTSTMTNGITVNGAKALS